MFDALDLGSPRFDGLRELTDAQWKQLLKFCDRTQLTLPLGLRCRPYLPEWVALRIDGNLANNAERWTRVKTVYTEVAGAFEAAGVEPVVLKGFSHAPDFVTDPRFRAQYDLDLWIENDRVMQARDAALQLGYESISGFDRFPLDHLPTMIRKTGWEWRGDQFDPDIPVSLELHFRLWDKRTEGFEPLGLEEFWGRRENRELEDIQFTALHPTDALGYAALHGLRHLLRGDLRPSHIYELAWFLEHKTDEQFWRTWRELHDPSLRRVEAICFGLARAWFGCTLPEWAAEEVDRLPARVSYWLAEYSYSPLTALFRPNKDELWLHLSLLDSRSAKAAVLARRLFPLQLPGPVDAVHLPAHALTWRIRTRGAWRYAKFAGARVARHTRVLAPTLWSGIVWWWSDAGLGGPFVTFFLAASLYDLGLFIFFLLYNLYLLQLGFKEDFMGLVSMAMLVGSIAASIPAALAIQRFGIRRNIIFCLCCIGSIGILRATLVTPFALLALATTAGAVSALWAVVLSPAVAMLTNERNRSLGFGIIVSSGIGFGVFGGALGGHLPLLLARLHSGPMNIVDYRRSLWIGCVIALLGIWPASYLRLDSPVREQRRSWRPSPRVVRFLTAALVWNLGTGAFNPFFNAFFARLHMGVDRIGFVFSLAQFAEAAGVLIAPMVFKAAGLIRGVSAMQLTAAAALAVLAFMTGPTGAPLAYGTYMVFQYMSEPGMFSYLMDAVPASERSQASALNFLVACSAQAIAAAVSGAAVTRFGYRPMLVAAAILCIAAALLLRILLGGRAKPLALHPEHASGNS